jgi:hypothetical protein
MMDLVEMLDRCLESRREGASLADCLALFPEQAGQLAPLLAVAGQFDVLRGAAIPAAVRARAKAQFRRAAAAQAATASTSRNGWLKGWFSPRSWGLAQGLVALLLMIACLASLGTAAAASGPGDPAYGMRVIIERVPARLALDPAARAEAELVVSERRLADLRQELARDGETDGRALAALLAGDESALRAAIRLSGHQRGRIAAAIGMHAQALQAMAAAAAAKPAAGALQRAAGQAEALQDAGRDPGTGLWHPGTPGSGPDGRPVVLPARTASEPARPTPPASATHAAPEVPPPPVRAAPGITPLPPAPTRLAPPTTLPIYQTPDWPHRAWLRHTVVPALPTGTSQPPSAPTARHERVNATPPAGTHPSGTPSGPDERPTRGYSGPRLPSPSAPASDRSRPQPTHAAPESTREPPSNSPATPDRGEPHPTREVPRQGPQPPVPPPPNPASPQPETGRRTPGPKH